MHPLVLPAEPAALAVLRERLRDWLQQHQWPEDEADDLVFAASEVASNAIEHAYRAREAGATVKVEARIDTLATGERVAELTVADHGLWRPKSQDDDHRGRGLALVEAMNARLVIDAASTGTRVTVRSNPVPAQR